MSKRRSIVAPVLLIILGLAFMAQNLGLVQWDLWNLLWQFWPIWLIAVGLELLLSRRFEWGSWAALAIVLLLMAGTLSYGRAVGTTSALGEPMEIAQPMGDVKRAEITIDTSVSELHLRAHQGSNLVQGRVVPLKQERVEQQVEQVGETLVMNLKTRGTTFKPSWGKQDGPSWDLRLSDQIPLSIWIDSGVGESVLDLTDLKLEYLKVDSGVGSTDLTLPATGQFKVEVDCGVGEVILRLPKELAAEIRVDQGLGEVKARGQFEREGKLYRTPGYASAANRVEIQIDGGVGEIRIEQ